MKRPLIIFEEIDVFQLLGQGEKHVKHIFNPYLPDRMQLAFFGAHFKKVEIYWIGPMEIRNIAFLVAFMA